MSGGGTRSAPRPRAKSPARMLRARRSRPRRPRRGRVRRARRDAAADGGRRRAHRVPLPRMWPGRGRERHVPPRRHVTRGARCGRPRGSPDPRPRRHGADGRRQPARRPGRQRPAAVLATVALVEAVAFDALGTLSRSSARGRRSSGSARRRARSRRGSGRVLHDSATLTLVDDYAPFEEIAAAALRTTLAQLGLDPKRQEPLAALQELEPRSDAQAALEHVRAARPRHSRAHERQRGGRPRRSSSGTACPSGRSSPSHPSSGTSRTRRRTTPSSRASASTLRTGGARSGPWMGLRRCAQRGAAARVARRGRARLAVPGRGAGTAISTLLEAAKLLARDTAGARAA